MTTSTRTLPMLPDEVRKAVVMSRDDFVPHRHCTVASGECFTEGRCLARCRVWKEKDHEARIKRLEQEVIELRQRITAHLFGE